MDIFINLEDTHPHLRIMHFQVTDDKAYGK